MPEELNAAQLLTPGKSSYEAQVVVIGSGPGGAVSARLLAEAGIDVLLIDAGEYHSAPKTPAFNLDELKGKYWNRGITFTSGKPRILYAMGRGIGGGSEVNNAEFIKLPEEVFERWQGNFNIKDLSYAQIEKDYRETSQELCATSIEEAPQFSDKLRIGAEKLNWKVEKVPRCFDVKSEEQMTMSKTYLPAAMRQGCRILPQTTLKKLRRQGEKWQLKLSSAGTPCEITCENVFLCAGATQTAMILKRSGLGKNVGRKFQCQPMIKLNAKFPEEVNQPGIGIPSLQVKEFAPDITLGCSISRRPYMALNMLGQIEDHRQFTRDWRHYLSFYVMLAPQSCGRLRKFPFDTNPWISYDLNRADMTKLKFGYERLSTLLFESGASHIHSGIADPAYSLKDRDSLSRLPRNLPAAKMQLSAVHLSSACPMGENEKVCTVDSYGCVFGTEGLIISDASILPTAPSVNPQATIMALARRNVQFFLSNRK